MTVHGTTTSSLDQDLEDLRSVMHRVAFPAYKDDILAVVVVSRCPSRLLWRAGYLFPERLYRNADEVCAELAARAGGRKR